MWWAAHTYYLIYRLASAQHWLLQLAAISYLKSASTLYNSVNTTSCLEEKTHLSLLWKSVKNSRWIKRGEHEWMKDGRYGCTNQIWIKCRNSTLNLEVNNTDFTIYLESFVSSQTHFSKQRQHDETDVHCFTIYRSQLPWDLKADAFLSSLKQINMKNSVWVLVSRIILLHLTKWCYKKGLQR